MNIQILRSLMAGCLLLSSCGEYKIEEEKTSQEDTDTGETEYLLQLNVQSQNNAKINYPLSAYVFDSSNDCILQEQIANPESEFSHFLPKGRHTFTLLSGLSGCSFPLEIVPSSYISPSNGSSFNQPLQIGKANFNLTQATQTNIMLSYVVASVQFSLSAIPANALSVTVEISPVSSGVSFNGNYKNDETSCMIPCTRNGYKWLAGPAYVLPNESSQTHLSIHIEYPGHNESFGYTYTQPLLAGYPYHFTGNYKDGVSLDGEFQVEGWRPAKDIEFTFDEITPDEEKPDGNEDDGPEEDHPSVPEEDSFIVTEMPTADSIWGYFYVWKLQQTGTDEAEATLVAPDQWYGTVAEITDELAFYEIDGIGSWRMFTTEEAKSFRDQYARSLGDLNEFIEQNGLEPFHYGEGTRYLCNEGQSTFSFTNNRILDAGSTVDYYLRPVKTVRLIKSR